MRRIDVGPNAGPAQALAQPFADGQGGPRGNLLRDDRPHQHAEPVRIVLQRARAHLPYQPLEDGVLAGQMPLGLEQFRILVFHDVYDRRRCGNGKQDD